MSYDDLRAFITKDGSEIREICSISGASLAEATVDRMTKLHFHRRSDEIYYILDGEGLIEVAEEMRVVSAAVIISHGCKHEKCWNSEAEMCIRRLTAMYGDS